ncbi:hypothetical protein EPYR_01637 [Erwinia pyrifoliae DSM 12163]|nr:hypothetical protein EPYR_01637 [Erwinia pyrifoliae DSM 12163]
MLSEFLVFPGILRIMIKYDLLKPVLPNRRSLSSQASNRGKHGVTGGCGVPDAS